MVVALPENAEAAAIEKGKKTGCGPPRRRTSDTAETAEDPPPTQVIGNKARGVQSKRKHSEVDQDPADKSGEKNKKRRTDKNKGKSFDILDVHRHKCYFV